jgi:hypothetical protein
MIDDEVNATRLARAILADVELYNADKIRQSKDPARDLGPEIAEGRALFVSRVAPGWQSAFERELRSWVERIAAGADLPGAAPSPKPPFAQPAGQSDVQARPQTSFLTMAALLVLAVALAIVWFVFLHRAR